MKLTIEHLAGTFYFYHGIKFYEPKYNMVHSAVGFIEDEIWAKDKNGDAYSWSIADSEKIIILRSDITKEIEHNGERFVPIERILSERKCDAEYNFMKAIEDDWASAESKFEFAPYSIIKKLHSWHFDTQGLLQAGLAIDINELNNNNAK